MKEALRVEVQNTFLKTLNPKENNQRLHGLSGLEAKRKSPIPPSDPVTRNPRPKT